VKKNYAWLFLRKGWSDPNKVEFTRIVGEILTSLIPMLSKSNSTYRLRLFHKHVENNGSSFADIGLAVVKYAGTFDYEAPIVRCLIGGDNCLFFLQKLNIYEFPLFSIHDPTKIILQFSSRAHVYLSNKLQLSENEDYILLKGRHNCILNCGMCCDGSCQTKSPLLGGLYCKGLTTVGKFCMYQLLGIPLPNENSICKEYFCGAMHDITETSGNSYGCMIDHFTPNYGLEKMEEFFSLFNEIQAKIQEKETDSIVKISIKQQRSKEIEQYWNGVRGIQVVFARYSQTSPIEIEKLEFLLGHNEFKKIHQIIAKSSLFKPEDRHELTKGLDQMDAWLDIYQKRKDAELTESAVPCYNREVIE
jgi:hypothetical protein